MRCIRSGVVGALIVSMGLLIGGCLTVGLGDPEKSKIDEAYIGFWVNSRIDGDEGKLMVVQAFDARTFLITQYGFRQTANGVEPTGGKIIHKAWLTSIGSQTFITLERMDAGRLLNRNDKPFIIAKLEKDPTTLTCSPVDPNFVEQNKVTTADEMMALVTKHAENPHLYREKEVYEKLTGERLSEAKDILAGFGESYE